MENGSIEFVQQLKRFVQALPGVTEELWTHENEKAVDQFIDDTTITTMLVYMDTESKLQVEFSAPKQEIKQLCYFTRTPGAIITSEPFNDAVQFGIQRGGQIKSLHNQMACLYAPGIALTTFGQRSIKDGYLNHMHSFIAKVSDEVHKKLGQTVLYIPSEALQCRPEEAKKDKMLVQRMETVVIHWMDQIKKLLNDQDLVEVGETCGPLQEIEFWESRCAKLSDVIQQIEKPGVKHIRKILQLTKSIYEDRFCKVAGKIQKCAAEAKSNLAFLSILKEPLKELEKHKPDQVSPQLLHIVNLIRIIWTKSPHYNTPDKITGLFRKMSNEVVNLCFKSISLDRIFEGFVLSSKKILTDCIQCCLSWKEIYNNAARIHNKHFEKKWIMNNSSIFVVVDAFIQRFKELLEVCDCQHHFARWEDGQQIALPIFGGSQGPEFTQSLLELESIFHCGLQNLHSSAENVFSVTNTIWFQEFDRFRAVIKDLEMMTKTLITKIFGTVNRFEEGLRLVDIFRPVSTREAVKSTIEEQMEEVLKLFSKELQMVRKELNQDPRWISDHVPPIAGEASWVRALKHRMERPMELLQKAYFMHGSYNYKQVVFSHGQLVQVMDEIVRKKFVTWSQRLDNQYIKKLEQPLIVRCKDKSGKLDINFDNNLLNVFSEIHYWDQLGFEIPQSVYEIYQNREDLRSLREETLLLTRDYNRTIGTLSPDELGLFRERINVLDKKMRPGLTSFMWSSKGASHIYLRECLKHVDKVSTHT